MPFKFSDPGNKVKDKECNSDDDQDSFNFEVEDGKCLGQVRATLIFVGWACSISHSGNPTENGGDASAVPPDASFDSAVDASTRFAVLSSKHYLC